MTKAQAIKHFGSVRLLADALRIHPDSIYQWGDRVPALRQLQLELMTDGRLKADQKARKPGGAK